MNEYRVRVKGLRPSESWIHLGEVKFSGPRAETDAGEERIRILSTLKRFYKNSDSQDYIVIGDVIVRMSGFVSISVVVEKSY